MNSRREFLAACTTIATTGMTGCMGLLVDMEVTVPDEVEVMIGSTTQLEIEANGIQMIRFTKFPQGPELVREDVDFSTSPSSIQDSDPPYWKWGNTQSRITIETHIRATENASEQEYSFEVTGWEGHDLNSERTVESGVIHVVE